MSEKFSNNILVCKSSKNSSKTLDLKSVEFLSASHLSLPPSPIFLRLSKKELSKSRFHRKNTNKSQNQLSNIARHTYIQASSANVNDILKLKDSFLNHLNKKIENIYRTINDTGKTKLYINIMIKDPLHKQIIVLMDYDNIFKFVASSDKHVANLNRALKDIKLDTFIDFIRSNHYGLVVISNKVASSSDLNVVESYIKNINSVDNNNIQ